MSFYTIDDEHITAGIACSRKTHGNAPNRIFLKQLAVSVQEIRAMDRCTPMEAVRRALDDARIKPGEFRQQCKTALAKILSCRSALYRKKLPPQPKVPRVKGRRIRVVQELTRDGKVQLAFGVCRGRKMKKRMTT